MAKCVCILIKIEIKTNTFGRYDSVSRRCAPSLSESDVSGTKNWKIEKNEIFKTVENLHFQCFMNLFCVLKIKIKLREYREKKKNK